MIGPLLRRLRARFRYRRFEDDLAEEMAFHQALKQQELEQQDGLSAADARDAARREMGNITRAREDSRGVWIASWLESVWQDIVYAVRSLRRQPAFTFAALAALILGIGLNSSAFTFFNAIGLRPWPVHDPSRVVRIYDRGPGPQGRRQGVGGFGIAEYRYLREHTRTFSGLIATRPGGGRLGHEEAGQQTSFEYVSDNYFNALGVDMTKFPRDRNLLGWARLCPRNDESAGRLISRRTLKGAAWIKTLMIQVAWTAVRTKNSYFRAQFYRLCRTTGDRRKAIMAVAASLLTVVYHMIREGTPYRDLGPDYFDQGDRDAAARRLVSRLKKLGYSVKVSEVAA